MDTRQAANVARAETRSKESNSMVMESRGSPSFSGALGGVQKDGRKLRKKEKKSVNLNNENVSDQLNLELVKSAARLRATDDSQSEITRRKKLKTHKVASACLKKGANQRVRGTEMPQVSCAESRSRVRLEGWKHGSQ